MKNMLPATDNQYPPVYLEALAYHEAGHAVMAVLLDIPIEKVAIGPRCTDPDCNGRVFIDVQACVEKLPPFAAGLLGVASEPAEKLAPSFDQFASMHKVYRHLKPFKNGVRNDLIHGFNAVSIAYVLARYAESTARQMFKAEYRDLAAALIEAKATAVHRLARRLQGALELAGSEVVSVVRRAGPSRRSESGRKLAAALSELQSDRAFLPRALRCLR